MRPLTPKQLRFVEEYLLDLNATAAAGRAGYADPEYGRQLIAFPNVAAEVSRQKADRTERTGVGADYVLRRLQEEAEYRGKGASHAARVAALQLLGKHVGMFTDRLRVEGSARLVVVEEIVGGDDHPPGEAAPGPA